MKPFKTFTSKLVPLDRANVDTDAIIPKQYLKSVKRTGFGIYLFDNWRYLDPGSLLIDHRQRRPNPDFILNQMQYRGAKILLARDNFGCGSSREHAIWALMDYGFRVVIAPSYSDIFYSNAFKNGLLLVRIDSCTLDPLFKATSTCPDYKLTVNLEQQRLITPQGQTISFAIAQRLKIRLLKGLDDIDLILADADKIKAYELRAQRRAPWLFPEKSPPAGQQG